MARLHLIKLCVGIDKPDELRHWIEYRLARAVSEGRKAEYVHTTRMMPRRRDELLEGGSLYWVMKGFVQARQRLEDIRPVTDDKGIRRCQLVLDPKLIVTQAQPRRPFQGWRYYPEADVPADASHAAGSGEIPEKMRRELMELGLL